MGSRGAACRRAGKDNVSRKTKLASFVWADLPLRGYKVVSDGKVWWCWRPAFCTRRIATPAEVAVAREAEKAGKLRPLTPEEAAGFRACLPMP